MNFQLKKMIRLFFIAFISTVFLLEANSQILVESYRDTYWNIRFRQEGTAVEMYAHDIWLHGERTLITVFDPSACTLKSFDKWFAYWSEVSCFAEDKNGQKWQYINRYTDTRTPLFFIPFLITAGPLREFNNISLQSASSTKGE